MTTPVLEEAALRGAQAAVATWTAAAPVAVAAATQATTAVQHSSAVAVRSAAQAVAVGSKAAAEAAQAVAVHGTKAAGGVAAITEVASHRLASVRPDGLVHDVTVAAKAAPKAALHALEVHAPAVLDAADHALDTVERSVLPAAAGAAQAVSRTVSGVVSSVVQATKRKSSVPAPEGTATPGKNGAVKPVPPLPKKKSVSHPPAKPAAASSKPVLGLPALPALPLPAWLKPPPPIPPLPQMPALPQLPGLPALPLPMRSAADSAVKSVATSMQALLRLMEQGVLQQGKAPAAGNVASPAGASASDSSRGRGFTLGAALFYALLAVCVKARCDVATPQEAAAMAALGAKLAALGARVRDSTQRLVCHALDVAGMGPSKGTHLRLKVAIWEAEGRMGAQFNWHKSDQAGEATGCQSAASQAAGASDGPAGGEGGDAAGVPGPSAAGVTSRVSTTSRKAALIALVAEAHDSEEDGESPAAPVAVLPAPSADQPGDGDMATPSTQLNGEAGTSHADGVEAMHVRVWHAATRPASVSIPPWLAAAAVACGTSRPAVAVGHAVRSGVLHALVVAGDCERTVTHFTLTAAKDAARQLVEAAHSLDHPSDVGRAAMAAVGVDAATVRVCRHEQWAIPSAVPTSGGWLGWALLPSVSFRFSVSWDWLPRPPKVEQKAQKAVAEHVNGNGTADAGVKASSLQASTSASSLRGPPTPPASPPWVKPPAASDGAATATPPLAKAPAFVQAVAAASPSPSVLKAAAAFNGAAAQANGTPPKPAGEGGVAWRKAFFAAKDKAAPSTPATPAGTGATSPGPAATPVSGGIAARMAAFEKKS